MNIFAVMYFDAHTHHLIIGTNAIKQMEGDDIPVGFYSSGIHPWKADDWKSNFDEVKSNAPQPHCIAIGETGLDKHVTKELSKQIESFEAHILLSEELKLPLILHCVKAWEEVLMIRKKLNPKQTWVFHGIAKTDLIPQILKENILLSLGKVILTNERMRLALPSIPLNRMLFETDNSDVKIETIYKEAGHLLGMDLIELENTIETNFKQTFTKWHIG